MCGMGLVKAPDLTVSKTLYTCPMHPEVISETKGSCPICGMDLVPMNPTDTEDQKTYKDLVKKMKIAVLPNPFSKDGGLAVLKGNIAIVVVSLLLLGGGIALDRSQATVGDVSFLRAMIPHHSLAITRSERFNNDDIRVCELAVEISEAQRREILEMEWLIDDIDQNGAATTRDEARQREVPDFEVAAERECNGG